jgi:peptidoglycan/xylan/chitin deacetylase (PgdA/CDA1 family)
MKLFKTPRFFRWIFPNKTWGFSRLENCVYLSFDDGPIPEVTTWVLDLLKEQNIEATFFCVGENVKKYPEIYARICAEGHAIGNHSMNHIKGINTSPKEYIRSIEAAGELIQSNLLRPPYGRISFRQTHLLKKKYSIIMWSWLSYDFDFNVPIKKILENAKKQIHSGDILVLHDNLKTFERLQVLLPEIIEIVKDKGLTFKKIKV